MNDTLATDTVSIDLENQLGDLLNEDTKKTNPESEKKSDTATPEGETGSDDFDIPLDELVPDEIINMALVLPETAAYHAIESDFSESEKDALKSLLQPSDQIIELRKKIGIKALEKYFPDSTTTTVSVEVACLAVFLVPPILAVMAAYKHKAEMANAVPVKEESKP